jgi:hypothetical protein
LNQKPSIINRILENITDIIIDKRTETNVNLLVSSIGLVVASEAVDKLISEGGEGFYNYVNGIGLANDSNLIVLSSQHKYYYDSEEIDKVRTVINLKELNRIKQITSLLYSHLRFLPLRCNFIGCFVNNEKTDRYALRKSSCYSEKIKNNDKEELGIVSRFPFINMLYSIMDLRTNIYMSERRVTSMLSVHGFKVIDMTELNGLTYFHSQKVKKVFN